MNFIFVSEKFFLSFVEFCKGNMSCGKRLSKKKLICFSIFLKNLKWILVCIKFLPSSNFSTKEKSMQIQKNNLVQNEFLKRIN